MNMGILKNNVELIIDNQKFLLDFDFIIKKSRSDGTSGAVCEVTLYNVNNYNFSNFLLNANGLPLFNGVVDSFEDYQDSSSKYSVYTLKEFAEPQDLQKQEDFLKLDIFYKNGNLKQWFNIIPDTKDLINKQDFYFNKNDSLEYRINKILDSLNIKVYFFDSKHNTIYLKNYANKSGLLQVIDLSTTSNFKSRLTNNIKPANKILIKCLHNIFLNPVDSLFYNGINYFVEDITITGGTMSGVIMEVTASDFKDLIAEEEAGE